MKRFKKFKTVIGNVYREDTAIGDQYDDISFEILTNDCDPQICITGLKFELFGKDIKVPEFCIYVTNPDALLKIAEFIKEKCEEEND